jgi:deoxyribodipyrimidine photo-lyase
VNTQDETGRVRLGNARPVRPERRYVLYWMIAARRPAWNFALDRAVWWARRLDKPLLVLEALRVDYPWASARLHRFILDGMADNARAFARTDISYYPYVEPVPRASRGLLRALAADACAIVTDDSPVFFLPAMTDRAARQVDVALELVDGNGLLPLAAADRAFTMAHHFRRFLQRTLADHVRHPPAARLPRSGSLRRLRSLPARVATRWPRANARLLEGDARRLARLPIDREPRAAPFRGGTRAANLLLRHFVSRRLATYAETRDHPDADGTSRLSPYLHFGHISAHQIYSAVMEWKRQAPSRARTAGEIAAARAATRSADAFLDQLVTWRELAFNTAARAPDYHRYQSLPAWARATLDKHRRDLRPHRYTRARLERARTHDAVWNAAQRQLLREGWFHNRLRMLWGKKILEWSRTPEQALETIIELMNRWSLDGRDPNSYAGAFWIFGRYDRPWPERPVFGTVRAMSSERLRSKVELEKYLVKYGPGSENESLIADP